MDNNTTHKLTSTQKHTGQHTTTLQAMQNLKQNNIPSNTLKHTPWNLIGITDHVTDALLSLLHYVFKANLISHYLPV
jgi:hypothetical protein